ncbi:substrate-binding domain-containing protein [Sphaerimonospora cavernae]|uniref:Substrate-binding domain-containing protein n=1 Tax=Sphaerimonospora cavernae TaxID=1740611 RepID=A0ABV6TZH9_9ACTN
MEIRLVVAAASLALLTTIRACDTALPYSGTGLGAVGRIGDGFTVGLLLPDKRGERYDTYDRPAITRAIAALCPKCEVVSANAGGDQGIQNRQLSEMLAEDVRVLILVAVRPEATASAVAGAKLLRAKVIAYDRLANGPVDAYTGFSGPEADRRREPAARLDITREAVSAARLAVDLACGKAVYGTTTVANGTTASIPAFMIHPAARLPPHHAPRE